MTAAARSVEWKRVFQSLSVILLALCILAGLQDDAHANRKKKRAPAYAPPYAEMVVDLGSGRVLKAVNADSPRFPASITKVMTIYLLFEAVEAGRFSLDSDLEVSRFAASQPPSKLGLRPGSTITVEQAILALITKSANDVAVVVAENLAGSQEAFARQMTRKARSLGMADTTFRNASGLPDRAQVTTARDLITLGVAIKRDFPDRYEMFSRRSFTFRGAVHRNHNRLLGRVKGVDGIKTGFTRASGFNLLTSARQGDRQIMTVVLGGSSGRARDQRVAALVADHLPDAVATTRLAAIGRKRAPAAEAPAPVERPEAAAVAAADPIATASSTRLDAKPAARRRIRPAVVASASTTPVEAAAAFSGETPKLTGPAVLARADAGRAVKAGVVAPRRAVRVPTRVEPAEPEMVWVTGEQPLPPKRQAAPNLAPEPTPPATAPAIAEGGWIIQLAATDDEAKALDLLDRARAKRADLLGGARPFTERVRKGEATLWRARFAGFDGEDAKAACTALKRSGFNCIAQRAPRAA